MSNNNVLSVINVVNGIWKNADRKVIFQTHNLKVVGSNPAPATCVDDP
jgi:hypothetical protein